MPAFVQVKSACKASRNLQSAMHIFQRCKSCSPVMNAFFRNEMQTSPKNQLEVWRNISTGKASLADRNKAGKSAGYKKNSQADTTSGAHRWKRIDHDCHKMQKAILSQAATAPLRHPRRPEEVRRCQSYDSSGGCSVNNPKCGAISEETIGEVECDVDKVNTAKKEVDVTRFTFSPVMKIFDLIPSVPQCFDLIPYFIQDIFGAPLLYIESSAPVLASNKNGDAEFIPPFFHILPKIAQHEAAKQKSHLQETLEKVKAGFTGNLARKSSTTSLVNHFTTSSTSDTDSEVKKPITKENLDERGKHSETIAIKSQYASKAKIAQETNSIDTLPLLGIAPTTSKISDTAPWKINCRSGTEGGSNEAKTKTKSSAENRSASSSLKAENKSEGIDCNKFSTKQNETNAANSDKAGIIDCSIYQNDSAPDAKIDQQNVKQPSFPGDGSSSQDTTNKHQTESYIAACESSAEPQKKKEANSYTTSAKYSVTWPHITGCGGVKLESGERSIDCSAIKNDKKDNSITGSEKTSTSPTPVDCSSKAEKVNASQNSTETRKSSKEFDCNKLKNGNTKPGAKDHDVPDSPCSDKEDKNGKKKNSVALDCSTISKRKSEEKSANENVKSVDCNKDSKDGKATSMDCENKDSKENEIKMIDCSKYKNKDSKDDEIKKIDCSKYKNTKPEDIVKESGRKENNSQKGSKEVSGSNACSPKQLNSSEAAKKDENSLDRQNMKEEKIDCSKYAKTNTEKGPSPQTDREKPDSKISSCKTDSKIENDFCKAREPKSTANQASLQKSKDCKPVTCPKKAEKKEAAIEKPEPPKRIKIQEKPELFNCCLKITGPQKIAIENCSMPTVCENDVLVKMHYVGLCGSDTLMYAEGTPKSGPTDVVLGHEGAGVVIEAGNEVKHLKKGDGVVIEPGVPCGQCKFCKSGRYNICPNTQFTGLLSTYVGHPARYCHKIPSTMNLQEAALAHPLALALHACHIGRVGIGSRVLILGACPRGLSTIIAARAMGADKIAIIDTLDKNLKVATELCADNSILADSSMSSEQISEKVLSEIKCHPNVVVDCCGCTKTVQLAVLAVENGGHCVLSGCQAQCAQMPILPALTKEVCLHTSFRSANMFPGALRLISSGRAHIGKMISHEAEFCDAQKAFHCAANEVESGAVKVMIKWPNREQTKNE